MPLDKRRLTGDDRNSPTQAWIWNPTPFPIHTRVEGVNIDLPPKARTRHYFARNGEEIILVPIPRWAAEFVTDLKKAGKRGLVLVKLDAGGAHLPNLARRAIRQCLQFYEGQKAQIHTINAYRAQHQIVPLRPYEHSDGIGPVWTCPEARLEDWYNRPWWAIYDEFIAACQEALQQSDADLVEMAVDEREMRDQVEQGLQVQIVKGMQQSAALQDENTRLKLELAAMQQMHGGGPGGDPQLQSPAAVMLAQRSQAASARGRAWNEKMLQAKEAKRRQSQVAQLAANRAPAHPALTAAEVLASGGTVDPEVLAPVPTEDPA